MPSKPVLPPTPEALLSLVTPIPPKTLHAYVLAHIPDAPPDTLASLASFFAALKPPPLLHCVRCHADYTEVDNNDRSCRVAHDDDSVNVEYVGYGGRNGSEYETQYDCCGQTVDGEGDEGPPPGWCYEGMHTTDVKRARFRADSSSDDDMLVSCVELKCHNARKKSGSTIGSTKTKRPRPLPLEDDIGHDYDDRGSIAAEDTGVGEIVHGVGELSQKSKGKGKGNSKSEGTTVMRRTKAVAVKTTAVEPQSRVRVQAPGKTDGNSASKKAGASAPTARVPAVRRGQSSNAKPRSAVLISSEAPSPPPSPKPRGRKPPSMSKMESVEIVLGSRSSTRSRVRGGGAETGVEKTTADSEGKVRKRRKVAARAAA